MKLGYHAALVAALVLAPACIRADSWPAPQTRNVFSTDGSRFVHILPGSSWGDAVAFAGAETGEYARGLFYTLQADQSYRLIADVALVNPVAPVDALVTNRGELVTFDNWHNFGFGAVTAICDPEGTLRIAYALEDLYGAVELATVPRSRSSRWCVRRPGRRNADLRPRVWGRRVRCHPVAAVSYLPFRRSGMCPACGAAFLDLVGRTIGDLGQAVVGPDSSPR